MTDPGPYRTGLCQMDNHVLCRGKYSFGTCMCACHMHENTESKRP